jgi:hypothetical protein
MAIIRYEIICATGNVFQDVPRAEAAFWVLVDSLACSCAVYIQDDGEAMPLGIADFQNGEAV